MNCPKCKSEHVAEATAGTLRCEDCDYAWLPHGTAPRFADAGAKKNEPSIGVILWPAILIVIILLTACGVLPWLLAGFFILLALLGAVVMQFSRQKN
jgi:Flp pilus assembly protein TadB